MAVYTDLMPEIFRNLAENAAFRRKFINNPKDVFKDYTSLTDDQKQRLTRIAEGFASDQKTWKTSIHPTTFKEAVAAILSGVILFLLFIVIWQTYSLIPNPPQVVQVGNTTQVFDSFTRAKDTLNILFPLFTAVVTFWLGVAVESKRGDQMTDAADKSSQSEKTAISTTTSALASSRGKLEEVRDRAGTKFEAAGERDLLDKLINELKDAEKAVRGTS